VLIEIGPVPADSALEYVRLARVQLAALHDDPGDLQATLTPYVLDMFDQWVDEWESGAQADDPFSWRIDLDPEVIEHTFYAFFLVVQKITDTYGDEGPPGDVQMRRPFRLALTRGVLDALEAEGDSTAEFARHLREYWPDSDFEDRSPTT